MQPLAYPVEYNTLRNIWQSFMTTGQLDAIDAHIADPVVLQSWRRCIPRFDPQARPRPNRAGVQVLASILRSQSNLLTIAKPLMEDMYQYMEGSGCAVLLADSTACVHTMIGDPSMIEAINNLELGYGTYWSEGQLGTNAMSLVLAEAVPSLVIGAEHFFKTCHILSGAAAPIHDVRGRIVGVTSVVGLVDGCTSHTLALVMAAARAITNQLQTDWYLDEANVHLTEVKTVLSSVSEGIIAWNRQGFIHYINAGAGKILGINPSAVLGRPLTEGLNMPGLLKAAVENRREFTREEITFHLNGNDVACLVSLHEIPEKAERPFGTMLTLQPIEQVRELVHQQLGSQAALTLDDLTSQSPQMRHIFRQARIAARGMAPVLLRGEGGVGKNHLARAIHNEGPRADKPFIVIDCRAIPHELMTSEFLGREQDTSTLGRPSKFELAYGGTMLLDQIESLSLELQTVLLRVLETGHVMRHGGSQPVRLDVRIMAATTANLERLVAEGSFIPHLYYRFGVFNIHIPPIRERVEDIPVLAERFLARIGQRDSSAYWIDDEATRALCRYPWPGNVREMESVLERAIVHSQDSVIRIINLPETVRSGRIITEASPQPEPVVSVAEAEREAIIRAGVAFEGKVSDMAEQLGIGRTTLWRKMKQLNISPDQFKT